MTTETDPSGLFGMAGAAVGAVLTFLVAFGVDLTPDQTAAILGLVATVGPLAVALAIRRKAWAPASVAKATDAAFVRGDSGEVPVNPPTLLREWEARHE